MPYRGHKFLELVPEIRLLSPGADSYKIRNARTHEAMQTIEDTSLGAHGAQSAVDADNVTLYGLVSRRRTTVLFWHW